MKQLIESLFGDNITKDPFEDVIDHLDVKKYTDEITEEALDNLFKVGGKRYGFYSMGSKREAFLKAIRKDDWVMLARKNYDRWDNYAVIWSYEKNNGYLTRYQIGWPLGNWFEDDINIGWIINSNYGSQEVLERLGNMGYDECILITDKKMKDSLKKRLKELIKR